MIPVTTMVVGRGTVSTKIKGEYHRKRPSRFTDYFRPLVFWNITYQCNLKCLHCYIRAKAQQDPNELTTEEAKRLAEEMVDMKIPLVILSGGEPLIRKDFWDIIEPMAKAQFPKLSLSTNGTMITKDVAQKLKDYGFSYVGISIDSVVPEYHDKFRGVPGAFKLTLEGIKNSIEAGLDVGIRTTITRYNIEEVPKIVEWSADNGIKRVAFYLLDTIGRGEGIKDWLPTRDQLKWMADTVIDLARKYADQLEILIVRGNFMGIYIAKKLAKTKEEFEEYLKMLQAQGDCGRKSVSIYPNGDVKPCQFIDWVTLGNVRERPLREILKKDNPALQPFLNIAKNLKGKCGRCPFNEVCGGGSRGRAYAIYGDPWAEDPLCFLEPEELAKEVGILVA
ncbi:MAG: radical SAM protein [Crenarchaeota archaeon]|nr:radical SAM protein [Thermoproteota archaeon]